MKEYIDVRNLPNPQPLVYTKRALAQGEFSHLIVHVNNADAKESVVRFARHAGFPVHKVDEKGEEFYITIANAEGAEERENDAGLSDGTELGKTIMEETAPGVRGRMTDTTLVLGQGCADEISEATERLLLSLPDAAVHPLRIILFGPALRRLFMDREWKTAVEQLISSGVGIIGEDKEIKRVNSSESPDLPEGLQVAEARTIGEILLTSPGVITLL